MRPLFFLIVLGAIGYLGWTYYEGKLPLPQTRLPEDSAPAAESSDPPARSASPLPVFQSRIKTGTAVIEGDKKMAPPRVFYMLERVSAETKSGIIAVVPGDEVKLIQRSGDKLRVSMGDAEFDVKESQVTRDLALAQDAEKREFARRTSQP